MKIFAYFEDWSRRPGETVRMAISTLLAEVAAELVRLTTGPGARDESAVGTAPVPEVPAMRVAGRLQHSPVGSYARLPLRGSRCGRRRQRPLLHLAHASRQGRADGVVARPCARPRRTRARGRPSSAAVQRRAGDICHAGSTAPLIFGSRYRGRTRVRSRRRRARISSRGSPQQGNGAGRGHRQASNPHARIGRPCRGTGKLLANEPALDKL